MGLMLHCGAHEVKVHELRDVPVPEAVHEYIGRSGHTKTLARTQRWRGIQHYDIVNAIDGVCQNKGMPIDLKRTRWGVSDDGGDLFGYIKFETELMGRPTVISQYFTDEMEPTMGFRHSNLSKFAAKGTIGGNVFVCDNMAITGEIAFNIKHTSGNIHNINSVMEEGINKYLKNIPKLGEMVRNLKSITIDDRKLASAYLRAGRDKLMSWSHIGYVDKLWENPTHDAFKRSRDGWRLYNAFNTVVKRYSPARQFDIVGKLDQIIRPEEKEICF